MLSNDVADVRRSCRDISPDPFQKIFCSLGNRSNRFAPDIGRASCGRGVNIHSTNGVMYSICHINHLLLSNRIIALSRRVQGEQNYSKKHAQFRLFVAGNTLSIRAAAALTGCLLKHTLSLKFLMDNAGPGRR